MDVGRGGVVWVFHPNGFVLFREPSEANFAGASATGNAIFDAAKRSGGRGLVRGPADPGGPPLITGYTAAPDPRLIVARVGRSQ